MSKTDKLLEKLSNGSIDGDELVTLLGRLGWWMPRRAGGSHQAWTNGAKILMVILERRRLKPYQIKDAQDALLEVEDEEK